MKQLPRRSWLPLALLVVALLLLVLHESGYLTPVENALHYVLDPLQRLFSRVVAGSGDLFQTVREVRELRARVDELQAKVDALTVENVRLREYEAEVQQLRAMLNFASEYPVSTFLGAELAETSRKYGTRFDLFSSAVSQKSRYVFGRHCHNDIIDRTRNISNIFITF